MIYCANQSRYQDMPYRKVGKSGLKLPAISLGLWQNFGHKNNFETCKDIILFAFDNGITHFDIANNYGPPPGSAELTFGRIINKQLAPYRDQLVISTKAGYDMWDGPYGSWGSRKHMISSLDQSLQRLGLDYVDIFYHHIYDPNTPLEETMSALASIVKSGKALYVGVSNYNGENTRRASKILKSMSVPFIINQPRYNIFDRGTEQDNLYQTLDELGLGSIVYSPLEQGLLTDRYLNGIPKDSRANKANSSIHSNSISSQQLEIVAKLNNLAKQREQSLAQMAIAWVIREGYATSALVGASSVKQLEDNIKTINNLEFSSQELERIDEITGY